MTNTLVTEHLLSLRTSVLMFFSPLIKNLFLCSQVFACTTPRPGNFGDQKRASDLLKLQFQVGCVSLCMGDENFNLGPVQEQAGLLTAEPLFSILVAAERNSNGYFSRAFEDSVPLQAAVRSAADGCSVGWREVSDV